MAFKYTAVPINLFSIDPSSTATGIAFFDKGKLKDYTTFVYKEKGAAKKVQYMGSNVQHFIEKYQYKEPKIIIESQFYHYTGKQNRTNPESIMLVQYTVGGIIFACTYFCDPKYVYLVKPVQWQGRNRSKKQTIMRINNAFSLKLKMKDNNTADAIGIGAWFLDQWRIGKFQGDL